MSEVNRYTTFEGVSGQTKEILRLNYFQMPQISDTMLSACTSFILQLFPYIYSLLLAYYMAILNHPRNVVTHLAWHYMKA